MVHNNSRFLQKGTKATSVTIESDTLRFERISFLASFSVVIKYGFETCYSLKCLISTFYGKMSICQEISKKSDYFLHVLHCLGNNKGILEKKIGKSTWWIDIFP